MGQGGSETVCPVGTGCRGGQGGACQSGGPGHLLPAPLPPHGHDPQCPDKAPPAWGAPPPTPLTACPTSAHPRPGSQAQPPRQSCRWGFVQPDVILGSAVAGNEEGGSAPGGCCREKQPRGRTPAQAPPRGGRAASGPRTGVGGGWEAGPGWGRVRLKQLGLTDEPDEGQGARSGDQGTGQAGPTLNTWGLWMSPIRDRKPP